MPHLPRHLPIALAALLLGGCVAPAQRVTTPPHDPAVDAVSVRTPPTPDIAMARPEDFEATREHQRRRLSESAAHRLSEQEVGYYLDVQQARLLQLGSQRAQVVRDQTRIVVTLRGTPHFEVGSAQLTPEARDALAPIARLLADFRSSFVSVHGHTDATGDEAQNLRLSQQRAAAVARLLVSAGVARERLLVVGHGQSRPIDSNDSDEGRQRNRRVELHLDPVVQSTPGTDKG